MLVEVNGHDGGRRAFLISADRRCATWPHNFFLDSALMML